MVADALTMGFRAVHPRVQRKQLQESLLEQTELELQKRLGIHRRGALRRAEAVVGCVVRGSIRHGEVESDAQQTTKPNSRRAQLIHSYIP